jgi:bacteriorhodopsin
MKLEKYLISEGIETTVIGFYFSITQQQLKDDPDQPFVHLLHSLGSPYWSAVMILIGVIALLVGLLAIRTKWVNRTALALLAGIWLIYAVAFVTQAIDFGHLDLTTIFVAFTFVFIVTQAGGDD